ncbi:RND efflux system, outer membrane lipoprotein, NodT family [Citreicella sp. SE45]|nr:RND efflux system, outer membrane lipoprotein, NodT family [Citreicella sp. SE45]
MIFLALAALYESWPIPFPVMLAVPVGALGALAAAWLFGQSNDVYFKVGMLTTIGLAARNAILIVQSAEDLRRQGLGIAEAAVEAARLRLRPILMTALTFIFGVLPLATATGAGAAAQNAIGTGVIGGMVASTYLWHLHGAGPLRPHHENGPLDPNESIEQMKPTRLVLVPMVLALSACAVGPDFRSPSQPVAANFAEGSAQPIGEASAQYWWRSYNDAMLNELVQTGLSQNLDIKTAISRVAEAQAAARATGLPAMISGSVSGDSIRAGGEAISGTTTTSGASFNPSLVLDLFGGERRSREAALASLQSAELSVGAARLTFLSQLVSSYIDLRYYQNALTITRQTLGTRRETLSLVQSQREAGAATALDEAQAQAALDESLASLPSLESGFYASSYAIATLLAQPVQTIEARLQRGAAQPRPGGNASAGVPADLLRNRPDVRAAERDYAAAVANVGVSEAQMYPSVSLGGTVSTSEGVGSWSFGPKVSLPVLNQGVLAAKRDQAIAQAEQAELGWRSSVLGAVEEVQASQSDYIRNQRAVAAYQRSVNSYERVVSLSRETYNGGTTTLLDFLDVQRSLASSRLTLASSVRDLAASWATLQVAAGKGWAFATAPAPAGNGS